MHSDQESTSHTLVDHDVDPGHPSTKHGARYDLSGARVGRAQVLSVSSFARRQPDSREGSMGSELKRSNRAARELFGPLPKRYDLLAELLSLGQNRRWRRRMVDQVAATAPQTILDVATGTAGVALQFAARTDAFVIGVDVTKEMLELGREKVSRKRVGGRVHLILGAGERLPFEEATFDALAFTYLLRYVPDPGHALRELARVVRPGGRMASVEFLVPPNSFWRFWWWLYTRTLLPAAGALGGRAWLEVGRFLGPSISEHYRRYPLHWQLEAWRKAGMVDVSFSVMSLGGGLVMWGTKEDE